MDLVETVFYLTKRQLFALNLEVSLRKEKAQIYYRLIML